MQQETLQQEINEKVKAITNIKRLKEILDFINQTETDDNFNISNHFDDGVNPNN